MLIFMAALARDVSQGIIKPGAALIVLQAFGAEGLETQF
jgi:hypothetical protein